MRQKWGRDLLLFKVIPVDGGEEVVCFDLTKVIPGPESVCAIFLQQALEERPGCAGRTRTHRQRLMEDVVIHLMCVPAVEWWQAEEHFIQH